MERRFTSITKLTSLVALVFVCSTLSAQIIKQTIRKQTVNITQSNSGQTINLATDQLLEISLPCQPSTGYSWYEADADINKKNIKNIEQIGDWDFVPDSTVSTEFVGQDGVQTLRFVGVSQGTTNLKLEYKRIWEKNKSAAEEYTITIVSEGKYTGSYMPPLKQNTISKHVTSTPKSLPSSFSWQSQCTPVKDQAQCGSCWAFAACGTFEANIKIVDGVTRDLSEQWLINCASPPNNGCQGGTCPHSYWQTQGSVYESDLPYADAACFPPTSATCIGTCGTYTHHEAINSYADVSPCTDANIKQAIYDYGPVWVCIDAGSAFQAYTSGIFMTDEGTTLDHAVVLVGWDDNGGTNGYWILRNSWNAGWGESGYMRIKYGTSAVGSNADYIVYKCGMHQSVAPATDFTATPTQSCSGGGIVQFTDLSKYCPTSWLWDFGDGFTSTSQNPSHTYANGTYNVTLTAYNSYGNTPLTKSNYIIYNTSPVAPTAPNVARCGTGSATLSASGGTFPNYFWYSAASGGTLLSYCTSSPCTYNTPSISSTTSYYVEDAAMTPENNLGTATGSYSFTTAGTSLFFDLKNNTGNNMFVTNISALFNASGTHNAQVWYYVGTYVGHTASSTGWTKVFDGSVTATSNRTILDNTDFVIPAGSTYGIIIWTPDKFIFSITSNTYNNSDLTITCGTGNGGQTSAFLSASSGTYTFDGAVYYRIKSCASSRTTCQAVIESALSCATIISPANGATGIPTSGTTLSWNTVSNATGYKVYFDQNNPPTTLVSTQTGTTYNTGTIYGTTYYWRIVPYNSCADPSCSIWNFSTNSTTPCLSTTPLSGFGNVCTNTTAGPNSFTISGTYLTSANVTVAALSGFTYCTTAGGTYTSSLSLPQSGGTYGPQTIYVKFNPTLVQSYDGNIVIGGGGAASTNEAATGSGFCNPPAISTPTSANITGTTADLGGNITSTGCTDVTERGIYWSTTNGFADGAGTKVSVTPGPYSTGAFTVNVTGLTGLTTYYYKAFCTNSCGTVYTTQGTFITTCGAIAPTAPDVSYCGSPHSFVLTASSGTYSSYYWWDASSGGNFLACNSSYTTPSLSSTTSYYVSDGGNIGSVVSLSTTLSGTVGGSGGNAQIYNLTNLSATNTMLISSIPVANYAAGTRTIAIYWRNGTYVGHETSSAGWNLDQTGSYSLAATTVYTVNTATVIAIAPGQTVGIYVWVSTDRGYAFSSPPIYQDANLKITAGSKHTASAAAFSGTLASPWGPLGSVGYKMIGCESSRTTCQAIIATAPSITGQPGNASTCAGSGAPSFTVTATGTSLTYQWQEYTTVWANVSTGGVYGGATSATLTITSPPVGMNGYKYRSVVSGTCTPAATSDGNATLTVNSAPTITGQPTSPAAVCAGTGTPTFTVTATGSGLTYQWQECVNPVSCSWVNISTCTGVYSGCTTASLVITNPPVGMNGYKYRVVVSGTCTPSVTSDGIATLSVSSAPVITGQPSNASTCAGTGTPSFTVTATGTITGYQWQECVNPVSCSWVNISTCTGVYSGCTTATLTITNPPIGMNGYKYKCIVSGASCSVPSDGNAILTVNTAPNITGQPGNQAVTDGAGTAIFTVTATGAGLTYQWERGKSSIYTTITGATSPNDGCTYSNYNTASLSVINPPIGMNGYTYRCNVSGTCSPMATSDGNATLTVNPAGTTYYSWTNAAPEATASWWTGTNGTGTHPANFTTAGETFTIQNNNTMTTAASWTVTGRVVINNGCTLSVTSGSTTLTVGALTINGGGTLTCSRPCVVNGATGGTNITGTINLSGANRNSSFVDVTLNSGAVWNYTATGTSTITVSGNWTNNASTFTASAMGYTFSGGTKTIDGSTANVIPKATFTGAYTNSGTLTCATLLTITGVTLTNTGTINSSTSLTGTGTLSNTSGALNITGGSCSITTLTNGGIVAISGTATSTTAVANFTNIGTINISGSGAITGITNNTGGIVNHSGSSTITSFDNATSTSTLNISTTPTVPTITTLTVSAVGNSVNYTGAGAQTVRTGTAFYNLGLSGSGAKTTTSVTVNGILSMEGNGTVTASVIPTYGTGATLQYKGSAQQTTGVELATAPTKFNGTGGVIINNSTGVILGNSADILHDLAITSGALTVNTNIDLTVEGTTTLNTAECLIIKTEGSFIDNGITINGAGSARVEKSLTSGRWWYIGLPLSSTIYSSCFGIFPDVHLYYYDLTIPNYVQIPNGTTPLDPVTYPLRGYSAKNATNPINAVFTGSLNTGTIGGTTNLAYNSGASSGYNLVCNPYPSAINWGCQNLQTPGLVLNNLSPTIWYRVNGNWATYNWMVNGTPQNGGDRHIPAMQAFWVEVLSAPNGGLQMNNFSREHNSQTFYKVNSEDNIFRIQVEKDSLTDEAVIGFYADATDSYDLYDSRKMFSTDANYPQIYTLTTDSEIVAINGQSDLALSGECVIPLGFKTNVIGTFTLDATNIEDFMPGVNVYLEDKVMEHVYDLRLSNTYTFTSGIVNDANRFFLHFNDFTTGIENNNTFVNAYSYLNSIYVSCAESNCQVELYDMLGNLVVRKQCEKGLNIMTANASKGIYVLKVVDGSTLLTKKLMIE